MILYTVSINLAAFSRVHLSGVWEELWSNTLLPSNLKAFRLRVCFPPALNAASGHSKRKNNQPKKNHHPAVVYMALTAWPRGKAAFLLVGFPVGLSPPSPTRLLFTFPQDYANDDGRWQDTAKILGSPENTCCKTLDCWLLAPCFVSLSPGVTELRGGFRALTATEQDSECKADCLSLI